MKRIIPIAIAFYIVSLIPVAHALTQYAYPESKELYENTLAALRTGTATSSDVGQGNDKDPGKVIRDRVRDKHIACNVPCENKPNESSCRDVCYQTYKPIYDEMDKARQDALSDYWQSPQTTQPSTTTPAPEAKTIPQPTAETKNSSQPSIKEISFESIKPGQVVAADAEPTKITYKGSTDYVELNKGASYKVFGKNDFEVLRGKIFVFMNKITGLEKVYRIKEPTMVAAVRGTQFLMDAQNDVSTIQVMKGSVVVSDPNRKKSVTVNAGYQLSATKKDGFGKLLSINNDTLERWYSDVPFNLKTWDESWKNAAAAQTYQRSCTTTAGKATPTQTLTADEQTYVDTFNTALTKFRIVEVNAIDVRAKKIFMSREKSDADGKRSTKFYIDAKRFYYPGAKANTWKAFTDQKTASGLLSTAQKENLTHLFDKATFSFTGWGTDLARTGLFSGATTLSGVQDLIQNIFSTPAEEGQEIGHITLKVDEEAKQWTGGTTTINVKSGKISVPITQVCTITYGTAVKISMPTKYQTVNTATGTKEFQSEALKVQ